MRTLITRRSAIAILVMIGSVVPTAAALASEPPPPEQTSTTSGNFHPLEPARILDTRIGVGTSGAVGPDSSVSLQVTGRGGVPAHAGAVVLNVTAVRPTTKGFVTVHPTGTSRPTASNLNFAPGQVVPNLVIAKLGGAGSVDLYNSRGDTHLVADVMGWYDDLQGSFQGVASGGSRQRAISPTRLLDTRLRAGPLGPDQSVELKVAGVGDIPADATAVVLNVTAVRPTAKGFLTVHPNGIARPTASNLNFVPGQTVPNLVIAKVGVGGKIRLYNSRGSSHIVVDATAYFEPSAKPSGGGELNAMTPTRVLDTRTGKGSSPRPVRAGETISLKVAGIAGIPNNNVDSVVLNLTVTQPTSAGFVTVHPSDSTRPTASNLNFSEGLTVPNLVIVKVGSDGHVKLFNSRGESHLIADVAGWISGDAIDPEPPANASPPDNPVPGEPSTPVGPPDGTNPPADSAPGGPLPPVGPPPPDAPPLSGGFDMSTSVSGDPMSF